jgi:hypothetical protein
MKSYTDIEQSKKLAEILPLESADMGWYYSRNPQAARNQMWVGTKAENADIPCWSLAALLDLLPSEFTTVGKYATTTYEIKIRKYKFVNDVDIYQIAYGNYKFYEDGNSSWKDMINTGQKEELIDAAFEMICWLKENNPYKE